MLFFFLFLCRSMYGSRCSVVVSLPSLSFLSFRHFSTSVFHLSWSSMCLISSFLRRYHRQQRSCRNFCICFHSWGRGKVAWFWLYHGWTFPALTMVFSVMLFTFAIPCPVPVPHNTLSMFEIVHPHESWFWSAPQRCCLLLFLVSTYLSTAVTHSTWALSMQNPVLFNVWLRFVLVSNAITTGLRFWKADFPLLLWCTFPVELCIQISLRSLLLTSSRSPFPVFLVVLVHMTLHRAMRLTVWMKYP